MKLEFVEGDIVKERVDAIVNAANTSLLGGGGVDGAIHKAAGVELLRECRRIRRDELPTGLPIGKAIATKAFDLKNVKYIIHTVGPVYETSPNPERQLTEAYQNSLKIAGSLGVKSIAFPAISTGIFGYPMEKAAQVSVAAVRNSSTAVELIRFVLFDAETLGIFKRANLRWEKQN